MGKTSNIDVFFFRHKDANTIMKLNIPLENKDDIKVQLIVPFNYPDTQCTLQVQNTNMSPQTKRYIYI
jgi:hypothetical protein